MALSIESIDCTTLNVRWIDLKALIMYDHKIIRCFFIIRYSKYNEILVYQ